MNYNIVVADNLKTIRISKGWSQEFVANLLGISQRTISRAECGVQVSRRTLKDLCVLYQVEVSSLYEERVPCDMVKTKNVVSEDVALGLLTRNSFIQDLEHEVVIRYSDMITREATMSRKDIEVIIPEALVEKKSYTLAEVINACLVTNQRTLSKIRKLAIA